MSPLPNSAVGRGLRWLIANPVTFRAMLERRGPVFIKLGQFLAMRPDLIPEEYCVELLNLADKAPTFSFEQAKEIIESELQAPLEDLFTWIDRRPVASASLAQVYRARTREGRFVAVKVQRPGVRQQIARQLRRARALARTIRRKGVFEIISLDDFVKEFSSWIEQELDFRVELQNLQKMHALARNSREQKIPAAVPDLSRELVLVNEFLEGTSFTDLLRYVREKDDRAFQRLGLDREVLARNLIEAILTQVFEYQFFHADTHPGNLIALENNRIGFVDFGLVDTLDPSLRRGLARYLNAIYTDDVEGMLQGAKELLIRTESSDFDAFRADFLDATGNFLRTRDRVAGTADYHPSTSPIASYMMAVLRSARQNHFQIPVSLLSMYRGLLTAETVANRLGGTADLREVGKRFFVGIQIQSAVRALAPDETQRVAMLLLDLMREAPRQLQSLLADLAEDRFVLRVIKEESPPGMKRATLRAKAISLAILSVAFSTAATGLRDLKVGPVALQPVCWAAFALTLVSLAWLWRQLR